MHTACISAKLKRRCPDGRLRMHKLPCMCCMVPTEEGMNTSCTAQWGTSLLSECLLRAGVKLLVNFSMIYQMTGDLHSSLPSVAKTMLHVFCQDFEHLYRNICTRNDLPQYYAWPMVRRCRTSAYFPYSVYFSLYWKLMLARIHRKWKVPIVGV